MCIFKWCYWVTNIWISYFKNAKATYKIALPQCGKAIKNLIYNYYLNTLRRCVFKPLLVCIVTL